MLEILSLLSPVKDAIDAYKAVTGLIKGDPNTRLLEELVKHNRVISSGIERLSDTILYAPNLQAVQDINRRSNPRRLEGREVREYLEPVQRALQQPILSSAIILTPEKMQRAMGKSPWDVLLDVRPLDFFTARLPPEGVPVQFEHGGVRYMGWQLRGTLPMLFDCEMYDLLGNTNVESIHGWSADKVQALQKRTAEFLNTPVEYQHNLKSGGKGPVMVVIPAGKFIMGSPDNEPERKDDEGQHEVTLAKPSAIGKFAVALGALCRFSGAKLLRLSRLIIRVILRRIITGQWRG